MSKTGKFLIGSNGTSGYWNERGQQTGEFKSWLVVYLEYLQSNGVDIYNSEIKLNGVIITVYPTEDGFNWGFTF
jgi:hypothetical protein